MCGGRGWRWCLFYLIRVVWREGGGYRDVERVLVVFIGFNLWRCFSEDMERLMLLKGEFLIFFI